MTRTLPIVLATVALIVCGLLHGIWTDRWTSRGDLDEVVARLDRVALTIGDWHGRSMPMDARQIEAGEIAGCLYRQYVRSSTGEAVTILLVCGRPGPISLHPPTACYAGGGYEISTPTRQGIHAAGVEGKPAEFLVADFRKTETTSPHVLRIHWAWSDTGAWKSPDAPRLAFAASPHLYKIYAIREMVATSGSVGDDPGVTFLEQLLPELERALFVRS